MTRTYICNEACNCSRCTTLRQHFPTMTDDFDGDDEDDREDDYEDTDDGETSRERVDRRFRRPPVRNESAVVDPDYAGPPTLNEFLAGENQDESAADLRGP